MCYGHVDVDLMAHFLFSMQYNTVYIIQSFLYIYFYGGGGGVKNNSRCIDYFEC